MKFKIRFAEQIVGTLSIIAIAALVFIIFFIGSKQKWFVPKHPYYTILTSASGVSEGMGINYKGFTIGKLKKITLTDDDRVRVDFYISEEYKQKATEGSIIELSASPIGLGTSCTFYPGNGTKLISDNSLIPEKSSSAAKILIEKGMCTIPESVDSISQIINMAMGLVGDIDKLIKELNDALGAKTKTVTKANGAVVPDPKSNGALKDILLNVDGILANLEKLTSELSDPQGLVPKLLESEENKGTFDELFTTINATISDVNGISTSVNDEMPQISVLLAQVQVMLQQVQDVLEGVKNNPLIKNGVPTHSDTASTAPKSREDNF